MLSGYIAAPCLFYSSLSTDKFISDKRHERKCPIFRRLTQLPSAWVPRKQSCLRNWLMLKAVKQRANSACWKKCLHGFMLSFLCGEAITVRRVRKDHERYLVCPPAQDRKVMCKSIQTLWDIPSYYGQSAQYITTSVTKIVPLTFSLNLLASLWAHYFLFSPQWIRKMVDFLSLYSHLFPAWKQLPLVISVLVLLGRVF